MNKKALLFETSLVIVLIIVLGFAMFQLAVKTSFKEDLPIGERSALLFNTYDKAEKSLLYSDQEALNSIRQSLFLLAQQGGHKEPICGQTDEFTHWSSKDTPLDLCVPNHIDSFRHIYNNPDINLLISPSDSRTDFVGIANSPIEIKTDPLTYTYYPSFKHSIKTDFSDYEHIKSTIKPIIDKCTAEEDYKDCLKTNIQTLETLDWDIFGCFTAEQKERISNNEFPTDSSILPYQHCDLAKECDEYDFESICNLDPCNLNCEWSGSECVKEFTQNELECLSSNTIPQSLLDQDIIDDLLSIFITPDQCVQCSELDCETYSEQRLCNLDPCSLHCSWEDGLCSSNPSSQRTQINDYLDSQRQIKFCVNNPENPILHKEESITYYPLDIKFSIYLPDEFSTEIPLQERTTAETTELLFAHTPEVDFDHYNLYFFIIAETSGFVEVNYPTELSALNTLSFTTAESLIENAGLLNIQILETDFSQTIKKIVINSENVKQYLVQTYTPPPATDISIKYFITSVDKANNENLAALERFQLQNLNFKYSIIPN